MATPNSRARVRTGGQRDVLDCGGGREENRPGPSEGKLVQPVSEVEADRPRRDPARCGDARLRSEYRGEEIRETESGSNNLERRPIRNIESSYYIQRGSVRTDDCHKSWGIWEPESSGESGADLDNRLGCKGRSIGKRSTRGARIQRCHSWDRSRWKTRETPYNANPWIGARHCRVVEREKT